MSRMYNSVHDEGKSYCQEKKCMINLYHFLGCLVIGQLGRSERGVCPGTRGGRRQCTFDLQDRRETHKDWI